MKAYLDKPELYVWRSIDPAPIPPDFDSESDSDDEEEAAAIRRVATAKLKSRKKIVVSRKTHLKYEIRYLTEEEKQDCDFEEAVPDNIEMNSHAFADDSVKRSSLSSRASVTEFNAEKPRTKESAKLGRRHRTSMMEFTEGSGRRLSTSRAAQGHTRAHTRACTHTHT